MTDRPIPTMTDHVSAAEINQAVKETLHICRCWMAYLLTRIGESSIRVEAADLTRALDELSCHVERDGHAYVIQLDSAPQNGGANDRETAN